MSDPREVSPTNAAAPDGELAVYRSQVAALEQKSQEAFDRTLITLAGGALGVSFAFVDKFVAEGAVRSPGLLATAWMLWVLTLSLVLSSHYISVLALRRTIRQVDAGTVPGERPGGAMDKLLVWLNPLGGVAFLVGLVFAGIFVVTNL